MRNVWDEPRIMGSFDVWGVCWYEKLQQQVMAHATDTRTSPEL